MFKKLPQKEAFESPTQQIYELAVLIATGKYRIPFRTPKSSPSAAMVLHFQVWESSSVQPTPKGKPRMPQGVRGFFVSSIVACAAVEQIFLKGISP